MIHVALASLACRGKNPPLRPQVQVKVQVAPSHSALQVLVAHVEPNPSLKWSTNGMAHWAASAGPAAHFALAAQHAMPLSPT